MNLPSFDPLWVSLGVTCVLVVITYFYMRQTKRMADIAQLSFLYERKPYLIATIYNDKNNIFFLLDNDKKSISTVYNVDTELVITLEDEESNIGLYHIDGPLFPGEKEKIDLSKLIKDLLIERNLMKSYSSQEIDVDDFGYPMYRTIYDIKKSKIEFEIETKISYEIDIKEFKNHVININRIFNVTLYFPEDEYLNPFAEDPYRTSITMKSGEWLRSRDYLIDKPKKINKKISGVKGLN